MNARGTAGLRIFDRVGVVVPAHNEEALLPACLAALQSAAADCDVPVEVLAVLDACTDGSVDAASAAGIPVVCINDRNVGAARRAGFAALLERLGTERVWLATTDADTLVPRAWLTAQLAHARCGVDAVVGTVSVTDWEEHPSATRDRFLQHYHQATGHPHVHGANLGISARSYLAVGGFPALPTHEDVALVAALKHSGQHVLHTPDPTVITSARRHARATGGFATYLNRLNGFPPSQFSAQPVV